MSENDNEIYNEVDFPDTPEKLLRFCLFHSDN
jgi:hypothetical protein